jgi:L-lactate dehydrogenase complex protein LldG
MSGPRARILARVASALQGRAHAPHPGVFGSWASPAADGPALSRQERFRAAFEAAGGEVVRLHDAAAAQAWWSGVGDGLRTAAVGPTVPANLAPPLPEVPPRDADVGVSLARAAVAETGSLLLDARDARRVQLLPPVHVVWVPTDRVRDTLATALAAVEEDLSSALGIHSGPSKSADIGQVLVRGVHGPGRLIAVLFGPRRP